MTLNEWISTTPDPRWRAAPPDEQWQSGVQAHVAIEAGLVEWLISARPHGVAIGQTTSPACASLSLEALPSTGAAGAIAAASLAALTLSTWQCEGLPGVAHRAQCAELALSASETMVSASVAAAARCVTLWLRASPSSRRAPLRPVLRLASQRQARLSLASRPTRALTLSSPVTLEASS